MLFELADVRKPGNEPEDDEQDAVGRAAKGQVAERKLLRGGRGIHELRPCDVFAKLHVACFRGNLSSVVSTSGQNSTAVSASARRTRPLHTFQYHDENQTALPRACLNSTDS